jgi:hypothetical protein
MYDGGKADLTEAGTVKRREYNDVHDTVKCKLLMPDSLTYSAKSFLVYEKIMWHTNVGLEKCSQASFKT